MCARRIAMMSCFRLRAMPPSFEGEPVRVEIKGTIDEFSSLIWGSLNEENKVSLFVRFIDIATGKFEERIINKNK